MVSPLTVDSEINERPALFIRSGLIVLYLYYICLRMNIMIGLGSNTFVFTIPGHILVHCAAESRERGPTWIGHSAGHDFDASTDRAELTRL